MTLFQGVKVIDLSTLFAGPVAATLLADFGAEVIKVEHPRGDDLRNWGSKKDGISFWWKVYSRNKKLISLDLNKEGAREVLRKLIVEADVLIENFRPGRMESWGLSYETLSSINPRLIMTSVTGFGQNGPYSLLPGFGTLAEAMSGFANMNGYPDTPPTLPPMALADGLTGITSAFLISAALRRRDATGLGDKIDMALYEPLMWILGPQISEFQQLGILHTRHGNKSKITSPRNIYKTKDQKWVALSASAQSIVERLFEAIGKAELLEDPKFESNSARLTNSDELDQILTEWTTRHNQSEIVEILRRSQVAVAPIYDTEQLVTDDHFNQRKSILEVSDQAFDKLKMQGLIGQLSNNPGSVRFTGKDRIGQDTKEILLEAGYTLGEIKKLLEVKAIQCPDHE